MSICNIKHDYLLVTCNNYGVPVLIILYAGIIIIYISSLSTCFEFKTRIFCISAHLKIPKSYLYCKIFVLIFKITNLVGNLLVLL